MPSKLSNELKMTRSFISLREELYLSLQRTAWSNQAVIAEILRAQNLSTQQYNVLRILRGASKQGLTCGEISERMVTHDSDVTRLLDKLEKSGMARRERCTKDRRVVYCFIEEPGLEVLTALDDAIVEAEEALYAGLTNKECQQLINLLEKARP